MDSLINKYKNLPEEIKASFWFTVCNVLVKGISFITLPIFSRVLTTAEYGQISVYSSWVSTITILCTLTTWGGVFNVGMVKYQDRSDTLVSSFQGLSTTITLIFFIITLFFMPIFEDYFGMSKFLIYCMYIEILMQIPYNLWSTVQRYNYKYRKLIIITLFLSITGPILSLVGVLTFNHKVEAKIVGGLISYALVGICFFIYNLSKGKKYFDKYFWEFGFKFNLLLVPHYLSMQILNQSDRIMISKMCGSSDAGIYSVAYNFASLLTLFTNGINNSLTPFIYRKMKEKDYEKIRKVTTSVVVLVAILTLGLISFIPDVFYLLLPESYYPSLHVIPPVTAACFFLFLYPLFGSIEFFYEENKYTTIASIIGAIANIILNYIFIKLYGFEAAAYTTLFCYVCFSGCHYFFMKKTLMKNKENIEIYDIRKLVEISIFVILGAVVMNILYNYNLVRWIIILIIVIMCLIKKDYFINMFKNIKEK